MTKPFNRIAVLGSGTMGRGIAQVLVQAGYGTCLYDLEQQFLDMAHAAIVKGIQKGVEKGKLTTEQGETAQAKLTCATDLAEAVGQADLVIEAVPEDMELKKRLFAQLDALCPTETVLASNTSSLSITAIAGATKRASLVAGLHFFNPVPLMSLVEVIRGQQTDEAVVDRLMNLSVTIGKTPVRVKDTPGFIVNRVARPFYGESFRLLDEGVADVAVLDRILRDEGGFRMGPFELMDLIGIDVNYAVTQSVYNAFFQEPRFKPHPIQRQMVEAGRLGKKTGRGFYTYDEQ